MTRPSTRHAQEPPRQKPAVGQRVLRLTACACLLALAAGAQPAARRATNIAALLTYPSFYNLRQVIIIGKVESLRDGRVMASDDFGTVRVISKNGAPDGTDEIRGEFWDLGRMKSDDPRLAGMDIKATFGVDPEGAWPRPGDVMAVVAASTTPASAPLNASIRNVVLQPSRYLDQHVTITGQFSGRNLIGDLPDAPAKSRYDFVLRSVDSAIWVTNIRARGKDFEFELDSRIDTGKWLQVSGTVRQGRGLQWIEADAGSLMVVKPQIEAPLDEPAVRVPSAPPPEVVFSAPTQEESDVAMNTNVRIQFSRDLDPASIRGNIRAFYVKPESGDPGEPAPAADFSTRYTSAARVLELRFLKPLERFRTIKIQLTDGILGTDKQPLVPWTLTFGVGGS